MMFKSATLALLLASVSLVSAHGSVSSVTDSTGTSYTGPVPGQGSGTDSAVREIATLSPITDPSIADMACGPSAATTAATVASVTAGGNITFAWRSGAEGTPWPHRWGPVMLYAYQCPSGTNATACAPPTDAEWFLIDAQGFDSDASAVPGSSGWVQDRFHNSMSVAASVPANMPNGQYLFRHEIIALHNAVSQGGAEYYVSCTQVAVTGGKDTTPKDAGAQLVAIPGVYNETQPGILVDVFSGLTAAQYQMPGPAVFGVDTTGSGSGSSSSSTGTESSTTDSSTATSTTDVPSTTTAAPDYTTTSAPASTTTATSCKRRASKRTLRKRKLARQAMAETIAKRRLEQAGY